MPGFSRVSISNIPIYPIMKQLLFSLMCLVFVTATVKGQDVSVEQPTVLKNEFGLNVGPATGMGLSYRHWFKGEGVQAVFLPVKSNDITMISAALNYYHTFKQSERVRFFCYLGNHLFRYQGSGEDLNNAIPSVFLNMWQYQYRYTSQADVDFLHYNIGFGPGISTGRVIAFNAMLGYGFYDVLGEFEAFPSFECSLMYRFK